jgi:CubicO group peptidase (beta-lactamase class C family)
MRSFAAVLMLFIYVGVEARDLRTASAESVGMSQSRLGAITDLSQRYVEAGKLAGVITMVSRRGKVVHFEAVGNRGVEDQRAIKKDDLFRIYSMSKPITAVAAMML